MTTYNLGVGVAAAQQKAFDLPIGPTAVIDQTDTVHFTADVKTVRIRNDSGRGYLFATVDGTDPSPGSATTMRCGAGQFAEVTTRPVPTGSGTTVKVRRYQVRLSPYDTGDHWWNPPDGQYGGATHYSVEAQINEGDAWPTPPVPL